MAIIIALQERILNERIIGRFFYAVFLRASR